MDREIRLRLVKVLTSTFIQEELRNITQGLEEGDWVLLNTLHGLLEEEAHENMCPDTNTSGMAPVQSEL